MNKIESLLKYALRVMFVFSTAYNQVLYFNLSEYQQTYFRNVDTLLSKYVSSPSSRDIVDVNIVAVNGQFIKGGIPIGPDYYYWDGYSRVSRSQYLRVETPND